MLGTLCSREVGGDDGMRVRSDSAATLESWGRLNDRQRQRFAEMFLRAAVRLGGPELRRWLGVSEAMKDMLWTRRGLPRSVAGSPGHVTLRGDRATAPLPHICVFRFSCFFWPIPL
jgi:hypothetical protein